MISEDLSRQGQPPGDAENLSAAPIDSSGSQLEIELKLTGAPATLEHLWNTEIAPGAEVETRRLVSTYYDTSDFRLRRRGFSMRVRDDGRGLEQTVKAKGTATQGVLRRGEWSNPLDHPTPDLTKLGVPEVLEKIGLIVAGELQPIFTVEVTRHLGRYPVDGPGGSKSRIEVAWDSGEIRAGSKTDAIAELELELLDGPPVALQQEAARLHQCSPLAFQQLSKSARGFALLLDEPTRGKKTSLLDLPAGAAVGLSLERILADCVSHWLDNHAAVLDGRDSEGVHQMRVALRRMRSALTIYKNLFSLEDRAWLQRELESLIDSLGSARDWDVFADELLQPVVEARAGDPDLKVLQQAVAEERKLAADHARAVLRSPAYLTFILELGIWLDSVQWRDNAKQAILERSLKSFAATSLQKRHKDTLKLGRNFEALSDEALHRVRISLKKLRYTAEFFASLYGTGKTKRYLKSMRQLQDDLGYLNDVAVAESRMNELCGRATDRNSAALNAARGTVIGWYTHALTEARPRIARDWRAFGRTEAFWKSSLAKK